MQCPKNVQWLLVYLKRLSPQSNFLNRSFNFIEARIENFATGLENETFNGSKYIECRLRYEIKAQYAIKTQLKTTCSQPTDKIQNAFILSIKRALTIGRKVKLFFNMHFISQMNEPTELHVLFIFSVTSVKVGPFQVQRHRFQYSNNRQ